MDRITAEIFVGFVGAVELAVAFEMDVDAGAVVTAELGRRACPGRPVHHRRV